MGNCFAPPAENEVHSEHEAPPRQAGNMAPHAGMQGGAMPQGGQLPHGMKAQAPNGMNGQMPHGMKGQAPNGMGRQAPNRMMPAGGAQGGQFAGGYGGGMQRGAMNGVGHMNGAGRMVAGGGMPRHAPMNGAGGMNGAAINGAGRMVAGAGMAHGGEAGMGAGMPQRGMAQRGMPQRGMPQAGMPQGGMPQGGVPQGGMPKMNRPMTGAAGAIQEDNGGSAGYAAAVEKARELAGTQGPQFTSKTGTSTPPKTDVGPSAPPMPSNPAPAAGSVQGSVQDFTPAQISPEEGARAFHEAATSHLQDHRSQNSRLSSPAVSPPPPALSPAPSNTSHAQSGVGFQTMEANADAGAQYGLQYGAPMMGGAVSSPMMGGGVSSPMGGGMSSPMMGGGVSSPMMGGDMGAVQTEELTLDDAQPTSPHVGADMGGVLGYNNGQLTYNEPLALEPQFEPQGVAVESGMSSMPNTTGWIEMPTNDADVQMDHRWQEMPTDTQFMGNAGAVVDQGWSGAQMGHTEMNFGAPAQMNFGSVEMGGQPVEMGFGSPVETHYGSPVQNCAAPRGAEF